MLRIVTSALGNAGSQNVTTSGESELYCWIAGQTTEDTGMFFCVHRPWPANAYRSPLSVGGVEPTLVET